ncbi:MAG: transcriptional regulator, partial [Providencia alcalifaciens]|nr:transcriptional regulator [Providencia alcalifaciens]
GLRTDRLYAEYLMPVCSPSLMTGGNQLKNPEDLAKHTLLHDSSRRDWQAYVKQLDLQNIVNVQQGPIFSHSAMVIQAAVHGQGVALTNNVMAKNEIDAGRLVCPFSEVLVSKNAFYLVCQESQADLGKIAAFRQWILAQAASEQEKLGFITNDQDLTHIQ